MDSVLIELGDENKVVEKSNQQITSWISNPYIKAATSDNTRIAYRSDIRHFENWGGKLPATPEAITHYLQAFATSLNARTLARRMTALKQWHLYQNFPDPTSNPIVQKTLSGIIKTHGKPKEKARPLTLEDLLVITQHLQKENSLTSHRDIALLQLGYFGAFRRSELVAIHYQHIEWKKEGIDILIPQSKTDATHEGQYCGIPFGKNPLCPVTHLKNWLLIANIKQGPLFREIKKGEKLKEKSLSPLSVNHILKKRAKECAFAYAEQFSGHSLRRGLATSASFAGANLSAIMRQGRWKQVNTIMEYVDATNRFTDNVATKILQHININDDTKENMDQDKKSDNIKF